MEVEDDVYKRKGGVQTISKIKQGLSVLRNIQSGQCRFALPNLDPCINKYAKYLSLLNLYQKELEERLLTYTDELKSIEEETNEAKISNENKVATLNRLIKETEDDIKAMLNEKERHQRALDAVKEEVKNKFENFKKIEIEKFRDAESVYSYKKLSLLKKIKALDADMEAVSRETSSAQNHLNNLKVTNRELRRKTHVLDAFQDPDDFLNLNADTMLSTPITTGNKAKNFSLRPIVKSISGQMK